MKHQAIHTLKFKLLARRLRLPLWQAVGLLESIWLLAQHEAKDGDLTHYGAAGIAAWVEYDGDPDELVDALVGDKPGHGWLDRDGDKLMVHDWEDHRPNWLKGSLASPRTKTRKHSSPSESLSESPSDTLSESPKCVTTLDPRPQTPDLLPPAPPPAAKGGDSRRSQAWKGVEEDLLKCGVVAAGKAVDAASTNGCRPDDVIAVIGYWRCSRGRWGAGALYQRILILRPEQDHTELWAEPSEEFIAAENRERSVKSQVDIAAKRESAAKEKAAEKAKLAALEAKFGQKIDAMSAEEVRDLVRREFPETADVELARYHGGRVSGLLRESLLTHFSFAPKGPTSVLEPL